MKIDEVIKGVLFFRDKIDAIKKEQKAALLPFNESLQKLENYLQLQLQNSGSTSVAAKGIGTAFLQNVVEVRVEDWDATLDWIKKTSAWEFLERRISKTVVQEYAESQGNIPPGVSIRTEVEVRVRRG